MSEQFQEKWKLVFRPELRKNKTIEHFCDSKKSGNALDRPLCIQLDARQSGRPGPSLWNGRGYSVASAGFLAGALPSGLASFMAASPVAFDMGAIWGAGWLMLATVIGSGVSAFAEVDVLWKTQALAAAIEKPRLAATIRRVLMRFVLVLERDEQ
jgi:hypothetical protein